MTMNASGTRRKFLTRWLATAALIGVYCLSIIGVSSLVMMTGGSSAQAARGGRGGGGGGRGGGGRGARGDGGGGRGRGGRGRGRGGIGIYGDYGIYGGYGYDDCWWSPRRGRWVCPYYY